MRRLLTPARFSPVLAIVSLAGVVATGCLKGGLPEASDAWGFGDAGNPDTSCSTACELGERKCMSPTVYAKCVQKGSHCPAFVRTQCPQGEMCTGGRCGGKSPDASCTDADGDGYPASKQCGGMKDCNDKAKTIYPGAKEKCDQMDNNCDGRIDEGCGCSDGATQACYTGKAATKGVGLCKSGMQTCSNSSWGECKNEVVPQLEKCDGKDNDCDGQTDESCGCTNGTSRSCYDGPGGTKNVGACSSGMETCSGGTWGSCQGQVKPTSESCDGNDNDCDGQTDEGLSGGSCNTGKPGICGDGTLKCSGGSKSCEQKNQPRWEHCDGRDDDCDGKSDAQEGSCGPWPSCHKSDPDFDNCCDYPPKTPGVLPTWPGGICDPNGDGSYSDGNWNAGFYCYKEKC